MALPNVFDSQVTAQLIERLQKIQPETKRLWGTMDAGQMLAHCNVAYEYVFEPGKYKSPPAILKLIMKWLVKPKIVNEVPYKQGLPTGSDFKIKDLKNFGAEKERLISFIEKTQKAGLGYFEGKESHGFGKLTGYQWNNMFYKHLDHHFRQFGA